MAEPSEFTTVEALAFIDAIHGNLQGKVGFKWFVERLSLLSGYVESTGAENEQLNAYLEWADARHDYEAFCAAHPVASAGEAAPDD